MPQKSINLLPKSLLKKSRYKKKIELLSLKIGYFLLSSLLMLTIFIFLPSFILKKKVENIQKQVRQKQQIIEKEKNWEELIQASNKQLNFLKELTQNKSSLSSKLDYLESFLADIALSSVQASKGALSFSASVSSTLKFAKLIESLQKAKKIEAVELTASNLDAEKGLYNFTLNLVFSKQ